MKSCGDGWLYLIQVWISLFTDISTFEALMPKPFLLKNSGSWKDKGDLTFPKGVSTKVNVITLLKFKLAYFETITPQASNTAITPQAVFERVYLNLIHNKKSGTILQ